MKTTITIDIDNYLSEEDKEEIARDLFKEELRKGFLAKPDHKKNIENYERVISNSVHYFLEEEIDSIVGQDHKELIEKKVKTHLSKDNLSYILFRNKSPWNSEPSVAQKMMDEIVIENRGLAENKIKKALENIDVDTNMQEWATEVLMDVLREKLTS